MVNFSSCENNSSFTASSHLSTKSDRDFTEGVQTLSKGMIWKYTKGLRLQKKEAKAFEVQLWCENDNYN